jgi:hypothetical protein
MSVRGIVPTPSQMSGAGRMLNTVFGLQATYCSPAVPPFAALASLWGIALGRFAGAVFGKDVAPWLGSRLR